MPRNQLFAFAAVLLLGMLIGALALGLFNQRNKKQMENALTTRQGFSNAAQRKLQFTDTQREKGLQIIEVKALRIESINHVYRRELIAVLDSMQTELNPLLTAAQRERLTKEIWRIKDRDRALLQTP